MTPFEPVTILTDHLVLRFLSEADLPALYDMFSQPEVTRYLSWPRWTDRSQAADAGDTGSYRTGSGLQLGIEQRTATRSRCVHLFHFHAASRRARMGYVLGRPYWGSGYMHEALHALVRYAFQTLDLNRLEADIDPRNQASARTLERLGFQKEGHLRERWIVNGEISDTWLYGLLRRDGRIIPVPPTRRQTTPKP
jgi:RimJ/RimL family protein N-acetyltransferase